MATVNSAGSSRSSDDHTSVGKAYNLMEYYFRLAVSINAVPFTYDKKQRKFAMNYRSTKFVIWFILMFLGILAETIQVTRELIRGLLDDKTTRGEWALVCFIFCSWTFVTGCHYNILRRAKPMVNHLNQTITTRQWFSEDQLPPSQEHKVARAHIISSCLQCFFQCIMVAVEGFKAQFLYSLVPVEQRSPLTAGLWALYAVYRVTSNFLCGYFQYFAGAIHVQTCNQILKLRIIGNQDIRVNLKYYRMVQTLSSRYQESYSGFFIPNITRFATENMILGIYGTVKFYDQMEMANFMNFPLMVVMMAVFIFSFYPKNATIYETTKDEGMRTLKKGLYMHAQAKWKIPKRIKLVETAVEEVGGVALTNLGSSQRRPIGRNNERDARSAILHETKRIAKSCPTIGVPFGSVYVIKKSTVVSLFEFIAMNTISTLLTYP